MTGFEKRSYIFNLCTLNELCTKHRKPRQIRSIHCTQFNLHEVMHVICIHTRRQQEIAGCTSSNMTHCGWCVCVRFQFAVGTGKKRNERTRDRTSARTSRHERKTNTRTQNIFRFKIDVDTIINPDDEKCGFPNVNYYDSRNESTTQRNKQMEMAK